MMVNTALRSHRFSKQNSSVSYGIFPYDWPGSPLRLSKHYRLLYLLLDTHHHSARSHRAVGCSCSNTELPGKICYHMNVLRVTNCFLIGLKKLYRRGYI